MRRLSAVHFASDDSLGVLHGDPSLTLLDQDDAHDDHDGKDDEQDDRHEADLACSELGDRVADAGGQSCDDAGEDQQRDTVADTILIDLLAEPHQECGTCGEDQNDDHDGENVRADQRSSEHTHGDTDRLDQCQDNSQVTRVCSNLLSSLHAFSGQTFQRRNGDGEKLQDNGCCDVRCDAQGKDGHVPEGTAGKQVEQIKQACVAAEQLGENRTVDSRDRDVGPDPENHQHQKREDDLLSDVGDAPCFP